MAHVDYVARNAGLSGAVIGAQPQVFAGVRITGLQSQLDRDFRHVLQTTGVIADRVMIKLAPSSPETPFVNGRVWLLRLADGYKAWEGWSNAGGYYTARGLEVGVAYIVVGIDPYSEHKATGAGPVIAAAGAA